MNSIEQDLNPRDLRQIHLSADLTIVGGGLSGVCCAVTAARAGIRVVLVQDRPVLGGNASSEIRLWILGATSHMGNNNRWAREGGVVDEILVENMWRNPEGNAVVLDSLLLEVVYREPNITLLLNTAVSEATVAEDGTVQSVQAFCSQNQTAYTLTASLFCDASGDGIVGFLAGAAFRMGAESSSEFGEALAPPTAANDLLGHSLYFYSRDTGRPVTYVPPTFALEDITRIPRFRELRVTDSGCRLWWLEYGGALDTIFETEAIKWELWRVAYGVWNYIKNSGEFPEASNLTLEWMGMIPGKRESRRFEGDFLLTQQDIVEQRRFPDAVSFGGWAIDLHPSEGIYSAEQACTQWHSKGVYQIPYRTMYSRNVPNLFLTGRLLSASHIAFGSTRVMATCAHNGQAVGMAAALCTELGLKPRDLTEPTHVQTLQQRLLRAGQHIPGILANDAADKARKASVSASSTLHLSELTPSGETTPLDMEMALLLPLAIGAIPAFTFHVDTEHAVTLHIELWASSREGNTTPDVFLEALDTQVPAGNFIPVTIPCKTQLDRAAHIFVMLKICEGVHVHLSSQQITGVLTVAQKMNKAVAKSLIQSPPADSGVETFAFWLPERRPEARNLAVRIEPPLKVFEPVNVTNGVARPWTGSNAWLPASNDIAPTLALKWPTPQEIRTIEISFDTDFDHPMESVLLGHPERIMPACVVSFDIYADGGRLIEHVTHNHQTRWIRTLKAPVRSDEISIVIREHGPALPAIFEIRCY